MARHFEHFEGAMPTDTPKPGAADKLITAIQVLDTIAKDALRESIAATDRALAAERERDALRHTLASIMEALAGAALAQPAGGEKG